MLRMVSCRSLRSGLRLGEELPGGQGGTGLRGAVDARFLPRQQRLFTHRPWHSRSPARRRLRRSVPWGGQGPPRGVWGLQPLWLLHTLQGPPARCGHLQGVGWRLCPSRGAGSVPPLCCQDPVMEAAVPSPPLAAALPPQAGDNQDKSETLPWPQQGAGNSGWEFIHPK